VRAKRTDGNQGVIVEALRRIGAKVKPTHMVGDDFPDLCVGFRGRTLLLEVKVPGEKQTKGQAAFASAWPGEVHVVSTVEEALTAVMGAKALA
jgi:hypothetical protein